jgi:hypothetical protein
MRSASKATFLLTALSLFSSFVLFEPRSYAVLGEKESSVEADKTLMTASRYSSRASAKFTVHELASDGLTIREYVNPAGIVYAVSWEGISHPDLGPLMGSYFSDFSTASKAAIKVRGRRPMSSVQGSSVIVEKYGHMRGARGRAYIPSLMPSGVNPNDIQ